MKHKEASSSLYSDREFRCSVCRGRRAFLELPCGHIFHPRCVFKWPLRACEVCAEPISDTERGGGIKIYASTRKASSTLRPRKGKWFQKEEEYLFAVVKEFSSGHWPFTNHRTLATVATRVLNCSSSRVANKLTNPAPEMSQYFYNPLRRSSYKAHVKKQRRFTTLENEFHWSIEQQHEFKTALEQKQNILMLEGMKDTMDEFWRLEIMLFLQCMDQSYEMVDCPPRTRCPLMTAPDTIINGQVDEETTAPADVQGNNMHIHHKRSRSESASVAEMEGAKAMANLKIYSNQQDCSHDSINHLVMNDFDDLPDSGQSSGCTFSGLSSFDPIMSSLSALPPRFTKGVSNSLSNPLSPTITDQIMLENHPIHSGSSSSSYSSASGNHQNCGARMFRKCISSRMNFQQSPVSALKFDGHISDLFHDDDHISSGMNIGSSGGHH